MKRIWIMIFALAALAVQGQVPSAEGDRLGSQAPLYGTSAYTLYARGVVQGAFSAEVQGDTAVWSTFEDRRWQRSKDLSRYPAYQSDFPMANALYQMAVEEMDNLIEADGTWRTGKWWGGVWTRDISYSTLLALSYMQPDVCRTSLMKKVWHGKVVQDTGTGGSWPISTDRVVWPLAAWQLYLVTGDKAWLEQSYRIIAQTLEQDYATVYDRETGLFRGESSFLDWREETYPRWMQPADIAQSECLGTNALYYQSYVIASQMARLLGDPTAARGYEEKAEAIKTAINTHLWLEEKGYYGQYLYGRTDKIVSPRSETLGEALCVIFGIAEGARAQQLVASVALTPLGTPCIYPQIPNIYPYHNNAVWPFVQAYWMWASAVAGNGASVAHSIGAIYRAAALFATNQENFVAATGDYHTAMNSPNMLWSIAGNLSIAHRIFAGITYTAEGLEFRPFVPREWGGTHRVSRFKYRKAELEIVTEGYGDGIAHFYIDGKEQSSPRLGATKRGRHTIRMVMNGTFSAPQEVHQTEVETSPETVPEVYLENAQLLAWRQVPDAACYKILRDGKVIATQEERIINSNRYAIPVADGYTQYQVIAVGKNGHEGFASEPMPYYDLDNEQRIDMSHFAAATRYAPCKGWTGGGAVEVAVGLNDTLAMVIEVPETGEYCVDFRYANGSGDLLNFNMCCNRTLWVNGSKMAQMVFPQRGLDLWHLWGWSNVVRVHLRQGVNRLELCYGAENENMNAQGTNRAMLDQLRLVRVK